MACTKADLESKFLECVRIFNGNQDETIGRNLDDGVTIRTIAKKKTYTPRPVVEAYLKDQFAKDHPHFDPDRYNVSVNGTQGTVQGNGRWNDRETVGPFQPVNYKFEFVCTGGSWKLSDGRSVP